MVDWWMGGTTGGVRASKTTPARSPGSSGRPSSVSETLRMMIPPWVGCPARVPDPGLERDLPAGSVELEVFLELPVGHVVGQALELVPAHGHVGLDELSPQESYQLLVRLEQAER